MSVTCIVEKNINVLEPLLNSLGYKRFNYNKKSIDSIVYHLYKYLKKKRHKYGRIHIILESVDYNSSTNVSFHFDRFIMNEKTKHTTKYSCHQIDTAKREFFNLLNKQKE